MKRGVLTILALIIAAPIAARADDAQPPPYSDIQIGQQANLTLPLEQILSDLSRRWGYSFIFDSRITKGKQAPPLDALASPEVALSQSLRSANLSLHKINSKTFAIKSISRVATPLIGAASPAVAAPILIDAIVVTATAATPLAGIGAPNILSIDQDALALLDAVKPADVIYELPQSFSTFTPANTMLLGALSGISLVDLRGLGPARNQVLVNGRRRTVTPGGNQAVVGVDLNSIPEPFLERIEILARPGGATVGTEAIAGSINFVTKKSVHGVEAGARYGISERGDAKEISAYVLAGAAFGDGLIEVSGGVNVTTEDGLIGADRENTGVSWGIGPSGDLEAGFGGSSATPQGLLAGAILSNGRVAPFTSGSSRRSLTGNGSIGASPFYNPNVTQQLLVPADRILAFFSASAEPSDNVELFLEGQFGWTSNTSQLAPLPTSRTRGADPLLGDAAAVDVAHPSVPTDVSALYTAQYSGAADSIIVERRWIELGPRGQTNERRYGDLAAGLRVDAGDLSGEIVYRYGTSGVTNIQLNLLDKTKLALALDPSACAAIAACDPIDLFRLGGVSQRAADFIRADPLRRRVKIEEHELRASASANIPDIFRETLNISGGIDFRRSSLTDEDLSPHAADVLGAFLNDEPHGVLNIIEAFGSIDAPLVRSSVAGDLDLSLAGRISGSNEYDPAFNFEGATRYQPIEGIEIYAQIHLGRRPPNLIELFGQGPGFYVSFSDPCGSPIGGLSAVVVDNCFGGGRLSVDPGFSQTSLTTRITMVGNPDLNPEKIYSQAYGASITPTDLIETLPGRMKISATWLSYEINDTIREAPLPLEECYASAGLAAVSCGDNPFLQLPLIRRDPLTQQIVAADSLLQNRGQYIWRGLDLGFDYVVEPEGPIDRFWINGLHTMALMAEIRDKGETVGMRFEGQVTDPRHVSRISVGAEMGPVAANLYLQRRGRVSVQSFIPDEFIPPTLLIDLTTRIEIREGIVATLAVENLTDRVAPVVAFGSISNTFPEYYDVIGRRFSIGLKGAF